MRTLIVYSSLTGNTRQVAEAIAGALPGPVDLYPVHKAPAPLGYTLVLPGFWVNRAMADPRMLRYFPQIIGQQVAFFGTLAAWPDSPHALKVIENTKEALKNNTLLGAFLCQGRLSPKRMAQYNDPARARPNHPMTPERMARLEEAQNHPDANDLANAAQYFLAIYNTLAQKRKIP